MTDEQMAQLRIAVWDKMEHGERSLYDRIAEADITAVWISTGQNTATLPPTDGDKA